MYSLFSGLYRYLTRKEEFFIIILGLDNAGKTVLFITGLSGADASRAHKEHLPWRSWSSARENCTDSRPQQFAPAFLNAIVGKIEISRKLFNFWDLGGQRELQVLWEKYYSECHAIIFVVDSTDKERIEEVKDTFGNVHAAPHRTERLITSDVVEGVPVLMLANKQDVENSLKVHEIKEIFNKIALKLEARDSNVLPVSALKG